MAHMAQKITCAAINGHFYGTYNSLLGRIPLLPSPPAASTCPLGSSVAV
jgi:hypothetical protein